MVKKGVAICLLIALMMFTACYSSLHVVGNGASGNDVKEVRQWYVLFGLIPINEVDTHEMAEGATDYEIKTEFTVVDIIIGCFTGMVSIQPQTVTVTK